MTSFRVKGIEYGNCNCDYGCPCQFNAPPTYGDCQYVVFARIDEGNYGDTRLDGLVFGSFGKWPGAVHEGDGTYQLVIDEKADEAQRRAIQRIVYNEDTDELKTHWAVFHAMSTTVLEPIVAPIAFEADMEARTARVEIAGLVESRAEPIRNPVTGEPHRAQIVLPEGFEFTLAEMASGTSTTQGAIPLRFSDSYAQLNVMHVTQDGIVR